MHSLNLRLAYVNPLTPRKLYPLSRACVHSSNLRLAYVNPLTPPNIFPLIPLKQLYKPLISSALKPLVISPKISVCCDTRIQIRNRPSFPLVYTSTGTYIAASYHPLLNCTVSNTSTDHERLSCLMKFSRSSVVTPWQLNKHRLEERLVFIMTSNGFTTYVRYLDAGKDMLPWMATRKLQGPCVQHPVV